MREEDSDEPGGMADLLRSFLAYAGTSLPSWLWGREEVG